jgi:hypothetical protein
MLAIIGNFSPDAETKNESFSISGSLVYGDM